MRLLGLLLVIMMMTACGEGDSKKEEAADPAKAETMETSAETAPSEEADQPSGDDSSAPSSGDDSSAPPDVLTSPPTEKK